MEDVMTRHLADHNRTEAPIGRARAFMTIERSQRPSRALLALQRRARSAGGATGLRHFLRIARGRSA